MPHDDRSNPDDWRLGIEPDEHVEIAVPVAPVELPPVDLSHARLAQPLYTLTTEHLGWALVAIYAVVSRAAALGARPLSATESRDALAALSIASDGISAAASAFQFSWVQIVEGWIFASAGASDSAARVVAMGCGLILVAAAFATRRYVGRAGALALATMLALSPSIAYYSRTGSSAVPAVTFAFLAVVMFLAVSSRPARWRAVLLGCAIGLALAADPSSLVTLATAALALSTFGLWDAATGRHAWVRTRVWWHRRRALVMTTIVVAVAIWVTLATAMFSRPIVATLGAQIHASFDPTAIDLRAGLRYYLPILTFYDGMIAIVALAGAVAILARRAASPLAIWAILWALITVASFAAAPPFASDRVVEMLVPMALVGAFGVEWLHHLDAWRTLRYPLAALVALTLYAQVLTGFIYPAPDSTEAPWARHALLFWSMPATSAQTPAQCARAQAQVSPDATVWIPDDAPALEWYFRSMNVADSPDAANIVARIAPAANPDATRTDKGFAFEETWTPILHALSLKSALQFMFVARPWSEVQVRELDFQIRATPAATATPAPAATPTPSASSTARPNPTSTPATAPPLTTP